MTARHVNQRFPDSMLLAGRFFLFVEILNEESQSTAVYVGYRHGKQQQPDAAAMPKDLGDSFDCTTAWDLCEEQRTYSYIDRIAPDK